MKASSSVGRVAKVMFFNQGQVCTSASRLLIEKSIYDRTLARLADIADGMLQSERVSYALLPIVEAHLQLANQTAGADESLERRVSLIVAQSMGRRPGGANVSGADDSNPHWYVLSRMLDVVVADVRPAALAAFSGSCRTLTREQNGAGD